MSTFAAPRGLRPTNGIKPVNAGAQQNTPIARHQEPATAGDQQKPASQNHEKEPAQQKSTNTNQQAKRATDGHEQEGNEADTSLRSSSSDSLCLAQAESAWRKKRESYKEVSEQAAAVATSAILPYLRQLWKQQEPWDVNEISSAVAAELAPWLQRQPGAVTSAVMDSLAPLLNALPNAHPSSAFTASPFAQLATRMQWPDLEGAAPMVNSPLTARFSRQASTEHGSFDGPRQPVHTPLSSSQSASSTSSHLRKTAPTHEPLQRAFVVNFRRLLEMLKFFAIIHELMKSTAIAALTLVAAGSVLELAYSFIFVAVLLSLFGVHFTHHDTMDVSDFSAMTCLVEDDKGVWNGRLVSNPNHLFKALSLSHRGAWRRAITCTFTLLCLIMWIVLFTDWWGWLETGTSLTDFLGGGSYATLLLIGTSMLFLHIAFEWLYWRETQCVMPPPILDSIDGDDEGLELPPSYCWLGLPSMWFTSAEAYNDLRLWIANAKRLGDARAPRIFPAEMAIFALDAKGSCQLRSALLHAKLYSEQDSTFLTRRHSSCGQPRSLGCREEPEELGMDLVFYDNQSDEFSQPEAAAF